jgi:hypothetical protein
MTGVKISSRSFSKHWLTIWFVIGFIGDVLLLNKIDDLFDNLLLLFYASLATITLILFYVGVAGRAPHWLNRRLVKLSPLAMQYAFGGLLSGMLIFYGRSGDWLTSAPYLLLIITVILGNELVDKRSDRLLYHLTLYFVGIFSYIVLVVPVITGLIGNSIFILSGLIALGVVTFVIQILYRIVPRFMALNTTRVILTIGAIYASFNILYFTNIIPPIPLSLTELSIVQSVERISSPPGYRLVYEDQTWLTGLPFLPSEIHPTGSSIACFARVFAPTKMETEIFHRWEYKDANGVWQERFRFGYRIAGTNEKGYRGYTILENFTPGLWRCSVENKRGQVLGRTMVQIDTVGKPKGLRTVIE